MNWISWMVIVFPERERERNKNIPSVALWTWVEEIRVNGWFQNQGEHAFLQITWIINLFLLYKNIYIYIYRTSRRKGYPRLNSIFSCTQGHLLESWYKRNVQVWTNSVFWLTAFLVQILCDVTKFIKNQGY